MSQVSFANSVIDHIRGWGIRLSRDEWAGMRLWLQRSAEELEAWSREQERYRVREIVRESLVRGESGTIVDKIDALSR